VINGVDCPQAKVRGGAREQGLLIQGGGKSTSRGMGPTNIKV